MIIFLHGKDTYRLQQKLGEIKQRYQKVHKSALNLEKIDVGQIGFRDFWDKLQQVSMFIKKKLFFLEEVFSNQPFKEEFLKKVKEVVESGDIIVVIEKGEVDKSDKLFSALKKHGKAQEFKPLQAKQLSNWLKKEFANYEAEIEEGALQKLIDFVGNDLWQMSNEIQKLILFKRLTIVSRLKKEREMIKMRDVEALVKPRIETAIFETIDAIAGRNKKKALRLLQKHLEKGDSALYLLKMINFQFRNLLLVKSRPYATAQMLGMHPFVLRKTSQQTVRFSLQELKKIYRRIFEVDFAIKTGKISDREGIKMLLAQI